MKKFLRLQSAVFAALLLLIAGKASAQVIIPPAMTAYTQNFNSLPTTSSATWTDNSTLLGWYATNSGTSVTPDDGSGTATGLKSFGSGTNSDRALGTSAGTGTYAYGLRFKNNTGAVIRDFVVSYRVEQWATVKSQSATMTFDYLKGATVTSIVGTGTPVTALDISTTSGAGGAVVDGNASGNFFTITATASDVELADGQEIMFRWTDQSKKNVYIGLDDITITPSSAPVTFYDLTGATASNLDAVTSWTTNSNGTAGTQPTSFTSSYQTFIIKNNTAATFNNPWAMGGTSSKLIVGDGTATPNLTIPATNSLTGIIDIASKATLTIANPTLPTLGTIATNSTVVYSGTGTQIIPSGTYYNLTCSGTGTKQLSSGATVNGALTVSSPFTQTGGVLTLNGTFTNSGTATSTGGEVIYNAGSAQTMATMTYNNLTLNGNATKTLSVNATVNGALTVNTGTTFSQTGGVLTLNGGFENFNTVNLTGGEVIYNAGSNQTILGLTYNDLTLNGTATKTLSANATVNGAFKVNSASTIFSHTGGILTLNGNASNLGTATSTSTVNYTAASGTQTMAGMTYNTLTLNGAGTKTLAANATVNGDFTVGSGSTFSQTANTLTLNGNATNSGTATSSGTGTITYARTSGTQTMAAMTYNNLTLTGGTVAATKQLAAGNAIVNGAFTLNANNTFSQTGGKLTLNGSITNTGTMTLTGGEVVFNQSAITTIPALAYNDLSISGSGAISLSGAATVNGAFKVSSNTYTQGASAVLTLNGGFTNTGTMTSIGGTVVLNAASVNQAIPGLTFNNLTVSGGGTKVLQSNATVNGTLNFTGGNLTTLAAANTLTLGSTATVSNETIDHYFQGQLIKPLAISGGGTTTFGGMGLSFNNTGNGNWGTVTVTRTTNTAITNPQDGGKHGINRYWNISPTIQAGTNATVTFTWLTSEDNGLSVTGQGQVWKSTDLGATWKRVGTPATITTAGNQRSISATTNSFSMWTVSDISNPLPVSWLYFKGKSTGNGTELNWATATEKNSADFEVERSENGKNFETIGAVKAAGNSSQQLVYSFTDKNPLTASKVYYRLKQLDLDGTFSYSEIITIKNRKFGTMEASVYPNPFNEVLNLRTTSLEMVKQVTLITMEGKEVYRKNITSAADLNLTDLPALKSGLYLLKLIGDDSITTLKVSRQ